MSVVAGLILGYLIGGFPTGILLCRILKGVDPRTLGSGSSGATNVSRILGKRWAILVLFIDILKGYLPVVFLAPRIVPDHLSMGIVAVASGAIVGHVWTPFARFHGGKGVATAAGAVLGMDPLSAVIAGAVWLLLFVPFRIVSLASIAAVVSLPVAMALLAGRPIEYLIFGGMLALFVLGTHRANLKRLLQGAEKPFR